MVPLIAKLDKRSSFFLPILIFLSFFIYATGQLLFNNIIYRDKSIFDFLNLTPLVWGWMFGAGMLAVKYFHIIRRFMKFTPLLLIPLFVMIFWGQGVFFSASGNKLGLIYFISFSGLILWFAFWLPAVTLPFDFSYGSYIWHMPIINFLLVIDCPSLAVLFGLTFFMAALSWFFVEKPVLRLKTRSLRVI
jgi:peptidoglycan/LPS O-acetylase OafA/YrhL